ncbi:hypothetical protein FNV43_RR10833 [Rhamnella rubrinervis]|uniref:Uncharacterized protein n=1 Tax=Rhamnella rubrinervis TaxID=2594499 RepID=A0A8K0MH65_9ROSA|nr:hypothetical protein FNV43_RR10833 [Rhamnella rubrinervis]
MNGYKEENSHCYFHPSEAVVGVCALCLNERLLILASRKGRRHHHSSSAKSRASYRPQNVMQQKKKTPITFPKIFALSSFLNRLEFLPWKSDYSDDLVVSTSQEDSFISIKFEENGAASWEKNTVVSNKVALENCNNMSWNHSINKKETKTVIEHGKPRGSLLRWRKPIGHLFQLIKWKRSNKGNVCHVSSKVDGVKVRNKGWIRTLTKRRTME